MDLLEDLKLDPHNGIPIYIQLKQAVQYAVATGRYPPGSRLPTVRQLAVSLKINPNTVSRVYSELEREGVVATRQGRGTFVLDTGLPEEAARKEMLRDMLEGILVRAHELGYSPREVIAEIQQMVQEEGK